MVGEYSTIYISCLTFTFFRKYTTKAAHKVKGNKSLTYKCTWCRLNHNRECLKTLLSICFHELGPSSWRAICPIESLPITSVLSPCSLLLLPLHVHCPKLRDKDHVHCKEIIWFLLIRHMQRSSSEPITVIANRKKYVSVKIHIYSLHYLII